MPPENTFANDATYVRPTPLLSTALADFNAYLQLKARRNTIRKELNNPNLTDKEVDDIIYIREHLPKNALLGPARRERPNLKEINELYKKVVEEAENINNGLNFIGYPAIPKDKVSSNLWQVLSNLQSFKNDVTGAMIGAAAIIPGMLWLRGFSAPLYYTANAGLTALSGYDWYKNGPNFWNVSGTVLGGLDLGLPVISKGVLVLNPNNTNIRFIRNIGTVPEVDEAGMFNLAPERNAFANFTWDKSFRTHRRYKRRPGAEYLIINPESLKGERFISTDPMDTFIPNRKLKASDVTLISGNPETRVLAESRGFNVLSSPEIDAAYSRLNFGRPEAPLEKYEPFRGPEAEAYDNAVNLFIYDTYGKPNVLDALKLRWQTGISPHIGFSPKLLYDPTTKIESKLGQRFGFPSHPASMDLPPNRIEEILDLLGSKIYRGRVINFRPQVSMSEGPFYLKNGTWNILLLTSDIREGKNNFLDWITNPEYIKAVNANKAEATAMGLEYDIPTLIPDNVEWVNNGLGISPEWIVSNNAGYQAMMSPIYPKETIVYNLAKLLNATSATTHELAHNFNMAGGRSSLGSSKKALYLQYKTNEVYQEGANFGKLVGNDNYNFSDIDGAAEAMTNTRDLGAKYGVKVGQEYPGDNIVLDLINKMKNDDNKLYLEMAKKFRTDNLLKVWKALNGTLWILIPGLFGITSQYKKEEK